MVLAHNGVQLTVDCLTSLLASTWPSLRILVVDNASEDGTRQRIQEDFPQVEVLHSPVNLGFAGGNNLGIRDVLGGGADHVLILNNDTLVAPDAVERLVRVVTDNPDVGAVSPVLTYAEPADLVWYGGATYDPSKGFPGRVSHYRKRLSDLALRAGPTDRFSGAAVLIPRAMLEAVGGFNEDLFFLYEDVDLSLRIRAAGRTIWFEPSAVIRHRVAMTQGGEHSPTSFYYGLRNQLEVARLHAPGRQVRCVLVATAVHVARLRRTDRRRAAARAIVDGLRDALRRRLGPRPA